MKKKFHLIIALVLALTPSVGAFAYAFTTASGTIAFPDVYTSAMGWQEDLYHVPDNLTRAYQSLNMGLYWRLSRGKV